MIYFYTSFSYIRAAACAKAIVIRNSEDQENHRVAETFTKTHFTLLYSARIITRLLLVIILLNTNVLNTYAANRELLHISTAFGPPISTNNLKGFFDLLIKQACSRIGYDVEIDHPQAGRALMLINAGYNDGDGPRVAKLYNFSNYPNLLRVNEKLMNLDFVAFSRGNNIIIHDWDDLSGHTVAIVTGWKILERRLSFLPSVSKVKDVKHALLMLKYGRTDVVIVDRYSGLETAHRIGLTKFHINTPPLYSKSMYLYLNNKYKTLAKKLANTLRKMKQDGTYNQIYKKTLSHVVTQ